MNTLFVRAFALFLLATVTALHAQVPQIINYQGRVAVGGVNFNGTGHFEFALVDTTGANTYWSNDGTSNAGSQPTSDVLLTVTNGLYSVLLGDETLGNMTAIPTSVFTNAADVRLRVWFKDGIHGFQLLTPDQRIAAAPYAMVAGTVSNAIPNFRVFHENGTFTVPPNVTRIMVEVWGGGGGGGGGGNGLTVSGGAEPGGNGAGGSGGGYGKDVLLVTPGDNLAVTVGLGGVAGGTATSGDDGGTSSVGSVNATGGAGGGGGGNAYFSDGNLTTGTAGNSGNPGNSGAAISIDGVQGGGGYSQVTPGTGGNVPGGAGAIGGAGGNLADGHSPGGGGASGTGQLATGTAGYSGAAGRVIIWW